MAIPTGYEKLAAIGLAYKNEYVAGTTYKLLNAVYYNGATYVALKDDPVTPPVADGVNWQYLAKGFTDGVLSAIEATDTSGLIGQAGATVGAQALLDVIADKVADKLLAKNQVVNNLLATIPGNALDACQGKALMDLINQQNSDLDWTTGSISAAVLAANGYVDIQITFPVPFDHVPLMIGSTNAGGGHTSVQCTPRTDGGLIRVWSSVPATYTVSWAAK